MKSALSQKINTIISITCVASVALGAAYLIVDVANSADLELTSTLVLPHE